MKRRLAVGASVLLGLAGCSWQSQQQQALQQASEAWQAIHRDTYVLRSAPREVMRAGETLERARQFAGYWGGAEDAIHFAYLSQRYSEIARLLTDASRDQERAVRLERTLDHLQFALREQGRELPDDSMLDEQLLGLTPEEAAPGLLVVLDDPLFARGGTRPGPAVSRALVQLAGFLRLNPQWRLRVTGYPGGRDSEGDNLTLSRQRVQAVVDVLTDLGVAARRIVSGDAGYGAEGAISRPRRVELELSDEHGQFDRPLPRETPGPSSRAGER